MLERYQRLSWLPQKQYIKGSPVVIEAGALLKDTKTNEILVQIKLRNIQERVIIACKATIHCFESNGKELKGVDGFPFLDIKIDHGKDFGSKVAIYLPENVTRDVWISIIEVVFENGEIWTHEDIKWEQVVEQKSLEDYYHDEELSKQYRMETNSKCKFVPRKSEGMFQCACGAINSDTVQKCYNCWNKYVDLKNVLESQDLEEKKNIRLKEEERQKEIEKEQKKVLEEQERQRIIEEENVKKQLLMKRQQEKKKSRNVMIIMLLCFICMIAFVILSNKIAKKNREKQFRECQNIVSEKLQEFHNSIIDMGELINKYENELNGYGYFNWSKDREFRKLKKTVLSMCMEVDKIDLSDYPIEFSESFSLLKEWSDLTKEYFNTISKNIKISTYVELTLSYLELSVELMNEINDANAKAGMMYEKE